MRIQSLKKNQKSSDDLKMSLNTAGKSPVMEKAIDIHSGKTSYAKMQN